MSNMKTCSVEGCGEKHKAKSFCQRHYDSFRLRGDPLKSRRQDPEHICRTSRYGYIILQKIVKGIRYSKPEHVAIWEEINGPKPKGFHIHHIDGTRDNNNIDNLVLLDYTTHKRVHSEFRLIDGEWWKLCGVCGILKPVSNVYYKKNGKGYYSKCKDCQKLYNKKYMSLHSDENKQRCKKRFDSNREEYRAQARRYYANNRERINAKKKELRELKKEQNK